jgi:hypothetical protein
MKTKVSKVQSTQLRTQIQKEINANKVDIDRKVFQKNPLDKWMLQEFKKGNATVEQRIQLFDVIINTPKRKLNCRVSFL